MKKFYCRKITLWLLFGAFIFGCGYVGAQMYMKLDESGKHIDDLTMSLDNYKVKLGEANSTNKELLEVTTLQEQIINEQNEEIETKRSALINHAINEDTLIDEKITPLSLIPDNDFITVSEQYSIDVGFAYVVWQLETGHGSSEVWLNRNNPAGIRSGSEYVHFTSAIEGYHSFFSLLEDYVANGRNTVDTVRDLWSEADDTSLIVTMWNQLLTINE